MKTFYYKLTFSPYLNKVKAKSLSEAKEKIQKLWPKCKIDKILVI